MIGRLWRKRLYRPEVLGLILRDLLGERGPILGTPRHLGEAARWIVRAQAATPDDGVSGGYSFEDGWIASYPETTGYIIPTLLTYSRYAADPTYEERALVMAEWLLDLQFEDGAFPGDFVDRPNPPIIFNTGQVLFGLLAAHEATKDAKFLRAAHAGARWLAGTQDSDGAWRRCEYRGALHSYNARAAWGMAEVALEVGDDRVMAAARRNLDWTCGQQLENGWFRFAAFSPDEDPFLHTIAYTSQGLLEAGYRLGHAGYIEAATRACQALLARLRPDGSIAATFDSQWRETARYSCLTGDSQMAVQWLRLYMMTGDRTYLNAALKLNRFLKTLQDCRTPNLHYRGAIKGSHPIWGRYLFGTFPNWATKFFMDALLLEEAVLDGMVECIRCW